MLEELFTAPEEKEETKEKSVWKKDLTNWGTGSIILGVLSLILVPILFGSLAVGSGVRVLKKGGSEKTKGIIGIILGISGLVLYFVGRFLLTRP